MVRPMNEEEPGICRHLRLSPEPSQRRQDLRRCAKSSPSLTPIQRIIEIPWRSYIEYRRALLVSRKQSDEGVHNRTETVFPAVYYFCANAIAVRNAGANI